MDRRPRGSSCDDELALVKAAAWAWYQHSSANEAKTTREFDLSKTPRQPRPSRYKLEAAAAAAANDAHTDNSHLTVASSSEPPSQPGSPASAELSLLDPYEIERITRHLDRLIISTHGCGGSGGRRRRLMPGGAKGVAKAGGFWLRQAVGLCGSRADVAEPGLLVAGRRSSRSRGLARS